MSIYRCYNHTVKTYSMYTCTTTSVFSQDGKSALIEAASKGHSEVGIELVRANANLDLQDKVCDDRLIVFV